MTLSENPSRTDNPKMLLVDLAHKAAEQIEFRGKACVFIQDPQSKTIHSTEAYVVDTERGFKAHYSNFTGGFNEQPLELTIDDFMITQQGFLDDEKPVIICDAPSWNHIKNLRGSREWMEPQVKLRDDDTDATTGFSLSFLQRGNQFIDVYILDR